MTFFFSSSLKSCQPAHNVLVLVLVLSLEQQRLPERITSSAFLDRGLFFFFFLTTARPPACQACRALLVGIHSSSGRSGPSAPYGHLQTLQRRRRGAQREKTQPRGPMVEFIITGLFSESERHEAVNVRLLSAHM